MSVIGSSCKASSSVRYPFSRKWLGVLMYTIEKGTLKPKYSQHLITRTPILQSVFVYQRIRFIRTVELQWLVYHGCFEVVLESLGKIPWLQIWDNLVWFFVFILKTVYCVYLLESPQWGDSNKYTQHTFML